VLVERGKLDEAERVALEARQTVGPEDAVSQLTTALALGMVRAAQGRDDDAEMLLRAAAEGLALTQFRAAEPEALRQLIAFLEDRGRGGEAAPFIKRLAHLGVSAPAESEVRIA
jgi:ATP/maltotriose-dependent transcriptional regulator MalT